MQDVYATGLPRMQSQLSFLLMESSTGKDFKLAIQCLQLLLLQVSLSRQTVCVYICHVLFTCTKTSLSLLMVENVN